MSIREELMNLRPLSEKEMEELDLTDYNLEEIDHMVDCGCITREFVVKKFLEQGFM